jgi:hypothetical protein
MKTVIIPSNGSVAFIEKCRILFDVFPAETVNYIFLDIRPVPDNYNDMITLSRNRSTQSAFESSFCEALKNFERSGENCKVTINHIYGDSIAVFRNYVQHHNADLVFFDQDQWVNHPHFAKQDVFKMVMRCGCEVMYISAAIEGTEKGILQLNGADTKFVRTRTHTSVDEIFSDSFTVEPEILRSATPASVKAQYRSVDSMLSDLETKATQNKILARRFSNLSRYFVKQSMLDRMLVEAARPLLWIRK